MRLIVVRGGKASTRFVGTYCTYYRDSLPPVTGLLGVSLQGGNENQVENLLVARNDDKLAEVKQQSYSTLLSSLTSFRCNVSRLVENITVTRAVIYIHYDILPQKCLSSSPCATYTHWGGDPAVTIDEQIT